MRTEGLTVRAPDVDATPKPESGMFCGLLPAVSTSVRVPVRFPANSGTKRIVTLQLADAARVEPHVFAEIMKSPGLLPPTLMLLKITAVCPLFVTVTALAPP